MPTVLLLIAAAAIGLMSIGAMFAANRRTRVDLKSEEVAGILERFVSGTGSRREWDAFLSLRVADPKLETIAARCRQLAEEFPPEDLREYTNSKGLAVLSEYIQCLRQENQPRKGAKSLEARL